MRRRFKSLTLVMQGLVVVIAIMVILGTLQLISNSGHVESVSKFLRAMPLNNVEPVHTIEVTKRLKSKTDFYIQNIEARHLENGMVVNRIFNGGYSDECDSLLFSSLYYVALNRLQRKTEAHALWQAIQNSKFNGKWYRHPLCKHRPPSRDMILGLLMVLNEEPTNFKSHLTELFVQLQKNDGFFGDGSMFVSYLSPGIAEILRKFSILLGISNDSMPDTIRRGFSTIELSVTTVKAGYRLHLHALQSWLEMELNKKMTNRKPTSRTATKRLEKLAEPFISQPLHEQRLEYVTQVLVEREPENLFFRFLRYQSASALSPGAIVTMMEQLLNLPQFPDDRLPNDCDRDADYLWQRTSSEYGSTQNVCKTIFSGVDFVWMSALLTDALGRQRNK